MNTESGVAGFQVDPNQNAPAPNEPAAQGQPEGPSGFNSRIGQLTKRWREAERTAQDLSAENAALSEQLAELSAKIDSLGSGGPPKSQAAPQSPAPAGDISSQIEAAVQRALAPIQAQAEQIRTASVIEQEQRRAFQAAAADLPEIMTAGSEAQRAFDAIWSDNPDLQRMPTGPALVIHAIRGMMGANNAQVRATDARKTLAASSPVPTSPQQRLADLPSTRKSDSERLDALRAQGRTDGWREEDWDEYLRLKIRVAGSPQR